MILENEIPFHYFFDISQDEIIENQYFVLQNKSNKMVLI